jgi:hypothetical protein
MTPIAKELHQLRLQLAAIRTAVSAAENTLNGLEKEDPNAVPLGEKTPIGSAPNNLKTGCVIISRKRDTFVRFRN